MRLIPCPRSTEGSRGRTDPLGESWFDRAKNTCIERADFVVSTVIRSGTGHLKNVKSDTGSGRGPSYLRQAIRGQGSATVFATAARFRKSDFEDGVVLLEVDEQFDSILVNSEISMSTNDVVRPTRLRNLEAGFLFA